MKIYYFILFQQQKQGYFRKGRRKPQTKQKQHPKPQPTRVAQAGSCTTGQVNFLNFKNIPSHAMVTYFRHYFGCSNQPLTESQSSKYQALNPSWKPDTFPGMLDYRENQRAPLVETLLCISLHIHKAQNISWFLRRALTPSTLELPLFTTHGDSCEIALLFLQCKIWQIEMICISILSPWGTVCLPVHHNTFKNPYHSIIL